MTVAPATVVEVEWGALRQEVAMAGSGPMARRTDGLRRRRGPARRNYSDLRFWVVVNYPTLLFA